MSKIISYEPSIIKETRSGMQSYSLADKMLQDRSIILLGEVNSSSCASIISQLLYLDGTDKGKPIKFYINSPGGEVTPGLAVYDVMKAIKSPVHTICIGRAASMGAVLFAAGDKRYMLKHGEIMIHDPLIQGLDRTSALELTKRAEDIMKTREKTASILAECTGKTLDEIYENTKQDTVFNTEDAIAFGLADELITEL